jgi:hypothetical protein
VCATQPLRNTCAGFNSHCNQTTGRIKTDY